MTSWDEKEGHSEEGHLPEEKLLLYLDGELPPKEAELVREHLTACWSCRMSADQVQEAVFAFVKYREAARRSLAPPPSDEQRFVRRLQVLQDELGNRSWLAHFSEIRRRIFSTVRLTVLPRPLMWVGALLVVAFAAIVIIAWLDRTSVVSASELLERASEAQAQALRTTPQPVVYQKLRIKRGARVATWELWRDTSNARFRQSVKSEQEGPTRESEAALASELIEVLRANRMNPESPLSVASFQAWRQSLAAKREEVSRSQTEMGEALTLRVSTNADRAIGQIIEASLVVRGRDWHPQAQLLKVRGEKEIREYELSETAYEVIPLAALTIFAEPTLKPMATAIPTPANARTPVPSPMPLPTTVELQNAEIAALYVLHQLKADLGEQIEIVRESNAQVIVRGLVETPQRKQEILTALRAIPFVTAQVQTFDEVAVQSAAKAQTPTTTPQLPEPKEAQAPPAGNNSFERRLARYYAEHTDGPRDAASINRRIEQLANSASAEASAALTNGYALRRLADQFAAVPDEPSSVATTRLHEVISDHLAEIKKRSNNLHRQLEPVLLAIAGTRATALPAPQPAGGTRKARVMQLFKAIEQVQRLSYRLFDSNQTLAASPEEAAGLMLQALAQLDHACLALEQDIRK